MKKVLEVKNGKMGGGGRSKKKKKNEKGRKLGGYGLWAWFEFFGRKEASTTRF